jgi:putative colanic acid biosynthesis UDP-glucose lipid carrier transferase
MVQVLFVPDFSALGLLHASWEVLGGMPMVSLVDTPHRGFEGLSKRLFDIVMSSLILAIIAVPLLCIAVAIKLSSPGPVIFRQRRYGLDGKEFEIYKFRSMTTVEDGKNEFKQATKNDARITPLGAFLRRTSLDELPQIINVLQGRMSLVGPRPHPVALNESQRKLIDNYMLRHKVRPGITGWAQVNGFRGETDTPEKMLNRIRCDLEYINYWSLKLDIQILWMTIFKVMDDPNAY